MDKVPSVFNNLRPLTIGFDDVFDHFETLLDDDFSVSSSRNNYPPYDIRKVGENRYNIEAALAGFNKKSKLNKKIEWGCFFPHLLNI
jgi:molecular chaperone IbpA